MIVPGSRRITVAIVTQGLNRDPIRPLRCGTDCRVVVVGCDSGEKMSFCVTRVPAID
jgi:hypothetical protein